jgi:hypothetical protein
MKKITNTTTLTPGLYDARIIMAGTDYEADGSQKIAPEDWAVFEIRDIGGRFHHIAQMVTPKLLQELLATVEFEVDGLPLDEVLPGQICSVRVVREIDRDSQTLVTKVASVEPLWLHGPMSF